MYSLLISVKSIHEKGIIHRDIKPKNFLYNSKLRKGFLIDFGLSQSKSSWEGNVRAYNQWLNDLNKPQQKINTQLPVKRKYNNVSDYVYHGSKRASTLLGNNNNNKQFQLPMHISIACNKCGQINCNGKAERAGSPGFRAPEVLYKTVNQTPAIDIWACGVILLSLLSKRYPFFSSVDKDDFLSLTQIASIVGWKELALGAEAIHRHIVTYPPGTKKVSLENLFKISRDKNDQCPETGIDLLYKLLDPNPIRRITAIDALNHPFFSNINKKI